MILEYLSSFSDNYWLLTWLGSICGHILSLYSDDFKGTKPFFRKMFPDKKETFYFRLDFLLLPLIGSIIAYVLLEPINLKTSIFSGLSWSGTIIALLKSNNLSNNHERSES